MICLLLGLRMKSIIQDFWNFLKVHLVNVSENQVSPDTEFYITTHMRPIGHKCNRLLDQPIKNPNVENLLRVEIQKRDDDETSQNKNIITSYFKKKRVKTQILSVLLTVKIMKIKCHKISHLDLSILMYQTMLVDLADFSF